MTDQHQPDGLDTALPDPDDPAAIPPDEGDAGPAGGQPTDADVPG